MIPNASRTGTSIRFRESGSELGSESEQYLYRIDPEPDLWVESRMMIRSSPARFARTSLAALVASVLGLAALAAASRPQTAKPAEAGWQPLFDGKTLTNWQPTKFSAEGAVKVDDGRIVLETGRNMTGITWSGAALPTTNYEISFQAMRVEGSDFFAGVTFPVDDSFCSLILGGWGGSVVGLSSINGQDASENDTSQSIEFQNGRWYTARVRVTPCENRDLARRSSNHQPGPQGQQDRHPPRDGTVEAAWRGVVENKICASRYSPAAPVEAESAAQLTESGGLSNLQFPNLKAERTSVG